MPRRITGGRSVAVLALTAVLSLGTLVAAAPANAIPIDWDVAAVVETIPVNVSGKVTAVSSTGGLFALAEVGVDVISGPSGGWVMTDASGNYRLTNLASGDYVLGFTDYSSTRTSPYAHAEQAVTVDASGTATLNVTLKRGSSLAGTLTKNVGGVVSPAVGLDVTVYDSDGMPINGSGTDGQGKYSVAGLAAGTYKVSFGLYASSTGVLPEFYNDVYTLAGAKPIVVGTAAAVTGINAELSSVPHVTPVTPTISGTKKVGSTLTAVTGTWGPGTVALKYQWYRSGVAITGATLKTYLLTGTDAADTMKVKVTGSKTGYSSRSRTSVATIPIAAGTLTTATPTITGTLKSGSTLTANPGTWGPGTVTLKYQWYRSGVAISGATLKTYALVSADRLDTIKVRVVGSKTGYTAIAKYSASTVAIP